MRSHIPLRAGRLLSNRVAQDAIGRARLRATVHETDLTLFRQLSGAFSQTHDMTMRGAAKAAGVALTLLGLVGAGTLLVSPPTFAMSGLLRYGAPTVGVLGLVLFLAAGSSF